MQNIPPPSLKWVQIDWLSINVRHPDNEIKPPNDQYRIKTLDITTRHFKLIQEIIEGNERIATVTSKPASKIINPFTIIIKFDNSWLYKPMLFDRLLYFLKQFDLSFHNLSRLDVSHDFVTFDNGLSPQSLIKGFLNDRYLLVGKRAWQTNGQQSNKQDFQYIRFGSKTSNLNFYLYNKSLEQRKIIFKPWIIQMWQALNLPVDKDIWRLEFSIKNGNSEVANIESGEISELRSINSLHQNFIHELYFTLVNKYFQFRINNHKSNVTRMCNLHLFNQSITSDYFKFFHLSTSTNRSDKIFIKRLEKTYQELREFNSEQSDQAYQLIQYEIAKRGLQEWSHNNLSIN